MTDFFICLTSSVSVRKEALKEGSMHHLGFLHVQREKMDAFNIDKNTLK